MRNVSPDAAAILALPHRHHPALASTVELLASMSDVRLPMAQRLLAAACKQHKLSQLDVEMSHPEAQSAVPFSPTSTADPRFSYDQGVADLVRVRLREAQR